MVRPTGLIDPIVEVRPAKSQVDDVLSEIHIHVKLGEIAICTAISTPQLRRMMRIKTLRDLRLVRLALMVYRQKISMV